MQRQGKGTAEVSTCRDKWAYGVAGRGRRSAGLPTLEPWESPTMFKTSVDEVSILSPVLDAVLVPVEFRDAEPRASMAEAPCMARGLLQLRRVEQGGDTCCFAAPTSSVCSLR